MNRKSKKHVAFFINSLRGGGAERVMLNLANGCAERGLKVDLLLAKAEGPYLTELHRSVRLVDLKAGRVRFSLPGLVRYLRRERPQALLSALDGANVVALWARSLAGVPVRTVVSVIPPSVNPLLARDDSGSPTRLGSFILEPRQLWLFPEEWLTIWLVLPACRERKYRSFTTRW